MSNRRLFGLGLLSGAAFGYWLNTEKGKIFRRDVAQKISEYSDDVSAISKDNALKLSDNLTSAMDDGQQWVSGAKKQLKSSIHELAENAEQAIDQAGEKLETGLEKASRKVRENASKLENGKSKKA